MKAIWFCVLLSLMIVAYRGFSGALSASQPLLEMPAAPSIAPGPPSLNAPVGAVAFDTSSSSAVPGSTGNDNNPADFSEYLFLHKTSHESLSAATMSGLDIPWRWLRIYAVTQRPTENR